MLLQVEKVTLFFYLDCIMLLTSTIFIGLSKVFFSSKYYTCSRLDPERYIKLFYRLTSIVHLIRAARTHAPSSSFTLQRTC